VSGVGPDPLESPREGREERRIEGRREVAWTTKIYLWQIAASGYNQQLVHSITINNWIIQVMVARFSKASYSHWSHSFIPPVTSFTCYFYTLPRNFIWQFSYLKSYCLSRDLSCRRLSTWLLVSTNSNIPVLRLAILAFPWMSKCPSSLPSHANCSTHYCTLVIWVAT